MSEAIQCLPLQFPLPLPPRELLSFRVKTVFAFTSSEMKHVSAGCFSKTIKPHTKPLVGHAGDVSPKISDYILYPGKQNFLLTTKGHQPYLPP